MFVIFPESYKNEKTLESTYKRSYKPIIDLPFLYNNQVNNIEVKIYIKVPNIFHLFSQIKYDYKRLSNYNNIVNLIQLFHRFSYDHLRSVKIKT